MIYKIDIPDEVVEFAMSKFGMDVHSLIQAWVIKPLMEHFSEGQKDVEYQKVKPQIEAKVKELKDAIKIEKEVIVVEEEIPEVPVEEPVVKPKDDKQIDKGLVNG